MVYRLIDVGHTSQLLFEGLYSWTEEKWHPVFESLGALAIVLVFLVYVIQAEDFLESVVQGKLASWMEF
jgi:hypothetical protein